MRSYLSSPAAAVVLALGAGVHAQQYAGDVINNTLPSINGAAINYFKIPVASKKGGYGTLLNYYSAPKGQRLVEANVQRVVIAVHGLDEDPWVYWQAAYSGLMSAKKQNPAINESSVAIIAPFFANGDGKGVAYPWTDGLPPGEGSTSSALVWQGSSWASGDENQYPHNHSSISSYTVLDKIIQYYNNATLYPNVKHIVIAGHSLGGQTVHRYAVVGDQLNTPIPMTYWAGNPDNFAWLNSSRPIWPASCTEYDDWRAGLSNYTNKYGADLITQGPAAVQANFFSRRFVFARGLADFGDYQGAGCAPTSQGANRGQRLFNFLNFWPARTPQFVDYQPNVGHDAPTMFASQIGIQRFYFDNWNGAGVFAPDAGPRMMQGDDPSPDPSYQAKWANYTGPTATPDAIQPTPTNIASLTPATPGPVWTRAGCYNDSSSGRALTTSLWSRSNATIETCVSSCAAKGYIVAGLESGSDCWCAKDVRNGAVQLPDTSCYKRCTGTNTELCGGTFTLSIYNTGPLLVYGKPTVVPSVGSFASIGCWSDSTSARSLSGKTPNLGQNNSVEACAAACSSFQYFGVEYGTECYCGNALNAKSTQGSLGSCSMACAGNPGETCGAGSWLNVYHLNNASTTAPTGSSTSNTVPSTSTASTTVASSTTASLSNTATLSTSTASASSTSTSDSTTTTAASSLFNIVDKVLHLL